MTRAALLFAGLLLVAALSGCSSFNTTEIVRPLGVDRVLRESDLEKLEADFAKTQPPNRYWAQITQDSILFYSVQKYRDYLFHIPDLEKALRQFPDNPYGWIYLGIYLALQHQPGAAIQATEEGITRLRSASVDRRPPAGYEQLYQVAVLNVALYNLIQDRPNNALVSLGRIDDPSKLDAFRRLAYQWSLSWASSGARRPEEAQRALEFAKKMTQDQLDTAGAGYTAPLRYPQYFTSTGRGAGNAFLEGTLAMDEGDLATAQKAFETAILSNPAMLEAYFGRYQALLAQGKIDDAREQLNRLLHYLPDKSFYRREVLLYSLGNLELDADRLDAAIEAYQGAIKEADERTDAYLKSPEWDRIDRRSLAGRIIAATLDPKTQGYPEAENNYAYAIVERVERGSVANPEEQLKTAEFFLEKALANPAYRTRYFSYANLARLKLKQGDWDAFLKNSASAIAANRYYLFAVRQLMNGAAEWQDLEQAAKGYTLAFDALTIASEARPVIEGFSMELKAARMRLEAGPAGRERTRALLRLYTVTGESVTQRALLANLSLGARSESYVELGLARQDLERGDLSAAERRLGRALEQPAVDGPVPDVDRRDALLLRARVHAQRCTREKVCNEEAFRSDLDAARSITPDWAPADLRRRAR